MKQILLLAALVISLASCEKENEKVLQPAHPQMAYRDLSSRVVNITTPAGIDINGDGPSDVWFDIFDRTDQTTQTWYHRFAATAGETGKLLVNSQKASPLISKGTSIQTAGAVGFEWKQPAFADLAERSLVQTTGAISWTGDWKAADHKYLAVQVIEGGKVYNGWIELSFDTAQEKVILHRSGLSKEAGKDIIAGQ